MPLTLHYDVITIPEIFGRLEDRGFYSSDIFPVSPLRPVLSKVPRISEHISAESLMLKSILTIGKLERVVFVIIILREDHDIVSSALAQQKMIFRL